jgi:hypothetical protein
MQKPYTRRLKKPMSDQLKSQLETRYDCRILRNAYGDGDWGQLQFTVKAFPLNPTVENLGHTPLDPRVELLLDIELSEYIIT